ncbi:MAG: hypothetical protein IPM39_07340 [Chloroflexi bacterium]|nr:hypothetical protein [Chloroflexota bacterium]
MTKKVFDKEVQKNRQAKGFSGSGKKSGKQAKPKAGDESVGAKVRGFWQRLFK